MFWIGGIAMTVSNPIRKDILAILVTTIASKSIATSGKLLSPHCNHLHHDTLETLICAKLVID